MAEVRKWLEQCSAATRRTEKARFSDQEHPVREDQDWSVQHQLHGNSLELMESYSNIARTRRHGLGTKSIVVTDSNDIMGKRVLV